MLPAWMILIDAFIHALLLAVLSFPLWNMMRYGNFDALPSFQIVSNYAALAILFAGLWMGTGYLMDCILFGRANAALFIPVLPFLVFTGLLIYLVLVFYYSYLLLHTRIRDEKDTGDGEEPESEPEALPAEPEILERIAVKAGQKIHVILIQDILYIQADGDYVRIVTETGKYLKEQTMKFFELHLNSRQFVRVHRSCIVNVEKISQIELYDSKNQQLTLRNGSRLKISISGYKTLRAALKL
jgi:hypothetical protein